jgi:hypothetical protein
LGAAWLPLREEEKDLWLEHFHRFYCACRRKADSPFSNLKESHAMTTSESDRTLMVTSPQHVYEVRPRKDKRGVDLISDALPFGPCMTIQTQSGTRSITRSFSAVHIML